MLLKMHFFDVQVGEVPVVELLARPGQDPTSTPDHHSPVTEANNFPVLATGPRGPQRSRLPGTTVMVEGGRDGGDTPSTTQPTRHTGSPLPSQPPAPIVFLLTYLYLAAQRYQRPRNGASCEFSLYFHQHLMKWSTRPSAPQLVSIGYNTQQIQRKF